MRIGAGCSNPARTVSPTQFHQACDTLTLGVVPGVGCHWGPGVQPASESTAMLPVKSWFAVRIGAASLGSLGSESILLF
jgi:hypothetical protein